MKPLSLYVHIPFCVKKCSYCSFAIAVGQGHYEEEYINALDREFLSQGVRISTVYIGGGTPSCLSLEGIGRLFRNIRQRFVLADDAEISFEVNPDSMDSDRAVFLKNAGVNRISMGVQSLDDRTLMILGRSHNAQDVRRAFGLLRSAGFSNINLDLIYGLPGQSREDVMKDLGCLLALGSEHLSLYALNIEERSLFFARRFEVDNDAQGEFYSEICRRMEGEGVNQYEVSNFARSGFESRHNLNYWQGGEYLGLGMSAHSHIAGERFWNADTLSKYLEFMKTAGSARSGGERLPKPEKLIEEFLFALRMNKGCDLGALEMKFGMEMPMLKKEVLESMIEMGLLEENDMFIRATSRGRLLLDEIAARII